MLEMNKVMLIGNLTRDPELSYLASGTALAKLGLAVNRRYKDKNGQYQDETTFVDIDAWAQTAEFCSKYLSKGRRVYVEGRLKFSSWEAQDGSKRSKLSVTADRVQFADAKPAADGNAPSTPPSYDSFPEPAAQADSIPAQTQGNSNLHQNQASAPEENTADDLPF